MFNIIALFLVFLAVVTSVGLALISLLLFLDGIYKLTKGDLTPGICDTILSIWFFIPCYWFFFTSYEMSLITTILFYTVQVLSAILVIKHKGA
jgi:hypothetical protein